MTFLTLGLVIDFLYKKGFFGKILLMVFLLFFVSYNYESLPKILKDTGWKISDIRRTAATILDRVEEGEKYNIVLLSGTGDIDGQNYRYFLNNSDKPAVSTEQRGEIKKLFIINEDRVLDKVVDSPVYEIVVFPDKTPKEVYEVEGGGPEITVLTKN